MTSHYLNQWCLISDAWKSHLRFHGLSSISGTLFIPKDYPLQPVWPNNSKGLSFITFLLDTRRLFQYTVNTVILFAQSIKARCYVRNEDVVGALPTGTAPTTSEWLGGGRVTRFPFSPLNVFVYIWHWAAPVNSQNRPHFEGDCRNWWLTRVLLDAIQMATSRSNMITYLCKIGTWYY